MKNFMQHSMLLTAFTAALIATPAYAVGCGQIFSDVVLTQDLVCPVNAFVVVGNNITINLNGHTLSCSGPNCGITDYILNSVAITSDGNSGLKVIGPGTIIGYTNGIHIGGGTNNTVSGVTITGNGDNGIEIVSAGSALCGTQIVNILNPPPPNFTLTGNQVSKQAHGISITNGYCGSIYNNILADNGTPASNSDNGIYLTGDYNNIYQNSVAHNGNNDLPYHIGNGISITGNSNRVTANYLTAQIGNGIVVKGVGNTISSNTVRFSGIDVGGFDLVSAPGSGSNHWNANNICNTQSGSIPLGVCHVGE